MTYTFYFEPILNASSFKESGVTISFTFYVPVAFLRDFEAQGYCAGIYLSPRWGVTALSRPQYRKVTVIKRFADSAIERSKHSQCSKETAIAEALEWLNLQLTTITRELFSASTSPDASITLETLRDSRAYCESSDKLFNWTLVYKTTEAKTEPAILTWFEYTSYPTFQKLLRFVEDEVGAEALPKLKVFCDKLIQQKQGLSDVQLKVFSDPELFLEAEKHANWFWFSLAGNFTHPGMTKEFNVMETAASIHVGACTCTAYIHVYTPNLNVLADLQRFWAAYENGSVFRKKWIRHTKPQVGDAE